MDPEHPLRGCPGKRKSVLRVFLGLILLLGLAAARATSAPAITTISPTSVTAGTAGFTLTVNGNGFVSGSTVQWNGVALQTTLVSATQLTALVGSSLIASSGTSAITVFSPGGLQSNAVTLTARESTRLNSSHLGIS